MKKGKDSRDGKKDMCGETETEAKKGTQACEQAGKNEKIKSVSARHHVFRSHRSSTLALDLGHLVSREPQITPSHNKGSGAPVSCSGSPHSPHPPLPAHTLPPCVLAHPLQPHLVLRTMYPPPSLVLLPPGSDPPDLPFTLMSRLHPPHHTQTPASPKPRLLTSVLPEDRTPAL